MEINSTPDLHNEFWPTPTDINITDKRIDNIENSLNNLANGVNQNFNEVRTEINTLMNDYNSSFSTNNLRVDFVNANNMYADNAVFAESNTSNATIDNLVVTSPVFNILLNTPHIDNIAVAGGNIWDVNLFGNTTLNTGEASIGHLESDVVDTNILSVNFVGIEPIESSAAVGYDGNGNLIPIHTTFDLGFPNNANYLWTDQFGTVTRGIASVVAEESDNLITSHAVLDVYNAVNEGFNTYNDSFNAVNNTLNTFDNTLNVLDYLLGTEADRFTMEGIGAENITHMNTPRISKSPVGVNISTDSIVRANFNNADNSLTIEYKGTSLTYNTNMSGLFANCTQYNEYFDIPDYVTDISGMYANATAYNQDLVIGSSDMNIDNILEGATGYGNSRTAFVPSDVNLVFSDPMYNSLVNGSIGHNFGFNIVNTIEEKPSEALFNITKASSLTALDGAITYNGGVKHFGDVQYSIDEGASWVDMVIGDSVTGFDYNKEVFFRYKGKSAYEILSAGVATVEITVNNNGGMSGYDTVSVPLGEDLSEYIDASRFERIGYTFIGLSKIGDQNYASVDTSNTIIFSDFSKDYTPAGGTLVQYSESASKAAVLSFSTLTALWAPNVYTAKFSLGVAKSYPSEVGYKNVSYIYGQSVEIPAFDSTIYIDRLNETYTEGESQVLSMKGWALEPDDSTILVTLEGASGTTTSTNPATGYINPVDVAGRLGFTAYAMLVDDTAIKVSNVVLNRDSDGNYKLTFAVPDVEDLASVQVYVADGFKSGSYVTSQNQLIWQLRSLGDAYVYNYVETQVVGDWRAYVVYPTPNSDFERVEVDITNLKGKICNPISISSDYEGKLCVIRTQNNAEAKADKRIWCTLLTLSDESVTVDGTSISTGTLDVTYSDGTPNDVYVQNNISGGESTGIKVNGIDLGRASGGDYSLTFAVPNRDDLASVQVYVADGFKSGSYVTSQNQLIWQPRSFGDAYVYNYVETQIEGDWRAYVVYPIQNTGFTKVDVDITNFKGKICNPITIPSDYAGKLCVIRTEDSSGVIDCTVIKLGEHGIEPLTEVITSATTGEVLTTFTTYDNNVYANANGVSSITGTGIKGFTDSASGINVNSAKKYALAQDVYNSEEVLLTTVKSEPYTLVCGSSSIEAVTPFTLSTTASEGVTTATIAKADDVTQDPDVEWIVDNNRISEIAPDGNTCEISFYNGAYEQYGTANIKVRVNNRTANLTQTR